MQIHIQVRGKAPYLGLKDEQMRELEFGFSEVQATLEAASRMMEGCFIVQED